MVGGIKLFVREEDVEAATKLLDESTPEKFDVEDINRIALAAALWIFPLMA
jgi:hypothetical protein